MTDDLHALRHLYVNPLALRKAQLVIQQRNECISGLGRLELVPLFAAIDQQRRGGLSAGDTGESVAKSRSHSSPELDRQDRELDRYERDVEKALEHIQAQIRLISGIATAIGRTHVPSKRERELAADNGPDCLACDRPIAYTPADRPRRGLCSACYQRWNSAGRPDIAQFCVEMKKAREAS